MPLELSQHSPTWHARTPLHSARYGHRSKRFAKAPFERRHVFVDEPPDQHACVCPCVQFLMDASVRASGREPTLKLYGQCTQRATQEDLLCDECRDWCIAIDSDGVVHQLAEPYRKRHGD